MVAVLIGALVALPFVEIVVFVAAARQLGVLAALGGLLLCGIVGTALVKREGLGVWRRLRTRLERGEAPAGELADAGGLLVAGLLLLLPGFTTDVMALLLLVPPVRRWLAGLAVRRFARRARVVVGPIGYSPASGSWSPSGPHRVQAGPATYGGIREVREVTDTGPRLDDGA